MMKHSPLRSLLHFAALIAISICNVKSYPVVVDVAARSVRCFHYSIPPHEDAHMVFLLLPSTVEPSVEEYYVDEMAQMNKERTRPSDPLPRGFKKDPFSRESDPAVREAMEEVIRVSEGKSAVTFGIKQPSNPKPLREERMNYFKPVVTNHVERFQKMFNKKESMEIYDGYSVCFDNKDKMHNKVMFEVILVSEIMDDEESNSGIGKEALTPLESELAASINAAKSIISEMRFMEKREHRMRVATESITSRIHIFSYISTFALLTVTYLQVTYLKRYFKKKKLM
mmetsp:Transcript_15984/g.24194  ORF Transcript_15984/g.24194 Transcript_15984/m.24194 type:complete len:284 (+) Transcript_15984:219-1070(+)|eukprot:CAMPEP_0178916810 /NCGR_PEP_ID=MMETSP0786-20121207/12868_1 /TAXON_ID=186022 /ORGANISM="Thalassionema frauenfeldii, Strain CCMP 1798" /LENGTH=283 /DNA_ID=CAMNT_0020590231 /DNA_START=135 /DNA_END=986 /DNA_ORIENTATION=-